jgi:hypothetical protein
MNNQNYSKRQILVLCILLLLGYVNPCFAQNPNKRGPKERRSNEQRDNPSPKKSPQPVVLNGNVILGTPTANSVTASIMLEKDVEAYLEYSATTGRQNNRTGIFKSVNGDPIEITLNHLTPNSLYTWSLNYLQPGEKQFRQLPSSRFATQKKHGATFSFGVQGDSHPEREGKMFNPMLYRQALDSVSKKRPDFYFLMGDDFSLDRLLSNNMADKDQVARAYLGNGVNLPPLFLVNGNHEQAAKYLLDGTDKNVAVLAANARKKYFPLPDPVKFYGGDKDSVPNIGFLKDYYSFEWGDALFVVIDLYWHSDIPVDNQPGSQEKRSRKDPWGITLGDAQYHWLQNTLEHSKAKFKFVFTHHVLGTGRGGIELVKQFEWGGYDRDGSWQFEKYRPNWELPIHQLMVKNGVTIFFQGHDHLFARQEVDGLIYQSVPNPADDTHTAFNREAYTSGVVLPNSGFLNVTVSSKDVRVEYVRTYLKEHLTLTPEIKENYSYILKGKSAKSGESNKSQ